MRHALAILALCCQLHAATYYVATNGNNGGTGAIDDPWLTIGYGSSNLSGGDILFVRGGTYAEQVHIRPTNVIVAGYSNELVIVDGQFTTPSTMGGGLVELNGDLITLSNISVKASKHAGIMLASWSNTVVACTAYSNILNGCVTSGGGAHVISLCTIYENSLTNQSHTNTSWSGGLNITLVSNVQVLSNTIYHNWGEGLSAYKATNVTFSGNVSYDSRSIFYLQNCRTCRVDGNLFYVSATNNAYRAPTSPNAQSVMTGDEVTTPPSSDNVWCNNLIRGCTCNFWAWPLGGQTNSGLCRATIVNNTFADAAGAYCVALSAMTDSTVFQNNLMLRTPATTNIATIGVLENDATNDIALSANLWWPSTPVSMSGTGGVEEDPLLVQSGGTGAGELTYLWFRLWPTSPARGAGIANANLTTDYLGTTRSDPPDIGGLQFIPYRLLNAGTIRAGTLRGP